MQHVGAALQAKAAAAVVARVELHTALCSELCQFSFLCVQSRKGAAAPHIRNKLQGENKRAVAFFVSPGARLIKAIRDAKGTETDPADCASFKGSTLRCE